MSIYPARSMRKTQASIIGISILAAALIPLSCASMKAPDLEPVAAAQAAQVQRPASPSAALENIAVEPAPGGKGWLIAVYGIPDSKYTIVKNIQPPFLNLYLPLVGLGKVPKEIIIDNDLITAIRSDQLGSAQNPTSEISIGLKKDVEYSVDTNGSVLRLSVTPISLLVKEEASSAVQVAQAATITKQDLPLPAPSRSNPAAKKITGMRFAAEEKISRVQIVADGAVERWEQFILKDPLRLVVDINSVQTTIRKAPVPDKEMPFSQLRIAQREGDVRIVLDFGKRPIPPYGIRAEGDMLLIVLGEEGPKKPAAVTPAAPPVKPVKAEIEKPKPAAMGRVKSIDFKEIDNKTRVIVGLTEKSEFSIDKEDEKALILTIKRCRIPSHLQRFIDTTYRYTSVARIIPEADKKDPTNTRIAIRLKSMAPYSTAREGNDIHVDIEKPAEAPASVDLPPKPSVFPEVEKKPPPAPPAAAPAPAIAVPMAPEKPPELVAPPVVVAPEEPIPGLAAPSPRIYTGRRISLDFQEADITHLFRLVAEVSHLNIITPETVKGKVTVRLVDVPWDQALDVILETNKLGKEHIGNVIRIAPMAEIVAAREERLRTLKKQQDLISDMQEKKAKLEPLITKLVPVNFASAKGMADQIKGMLSERGQPLTRIDERTNTLIITDLEYNVENAVTMVRKLDTPTPQVLIEARVVEANSNFTRELGIQWGGRFLSSPSTGNAFSGNNVVIGGTSAGGQGPSGSNWIVNLPAATGLGTGGAMGLTLGNVLNTLLLDIQLSAMESTGAGRVVSNPKVATLDNKQAVITQGQRIPYPRQTQDGISTDFIDATLNMTVTPHITFDGSISMKIEIKKEAPNFGRIVLGVPAVDTRRASTEVLVKNGETTVIGGIITSEDIAAMAGVPWFNRLPVLGHLFRTRSNVKTDTELLIFITPRIITPSPSISLGPWRDEKVG